MTDATGQDHRPQRTNGLSRATAVLVGLEALALLALAGWQVVALTAGDTDSAVSAVALIVLTAVGAVVVAAFAAAIRAGRSWGRSGGIVTQLLVLAVALGAATGQYAHPLIGLALAVPAVVCFALLIALARRSAPPKDAGR